MILIIIYLSKPSINCNIATNSNNSDSQSANATSYLHSSMSLLFMFYFFCSDVVIKLAPIKIKKKVPLSDLEQALTESYIYLTIASVLLIIITTSVYLVREAYLLGRNIIWYPNQVSDKFNSINALEQYLSDRSSTSKIRGSFDGNLDTLTHLYEHFW
jgi:cell division protein FtsL